MPKCHDCGKFCRPVEWQMIYSCALPEPQEEIYKCASCVEKNGSFVPQSGIKPEHSCGGLTHSFEVSGLAPRKDRLAWPARTPGASSSALRLSAGILTWRAVALNSSKARAN